MVTLATAYLIVSSIFFILGGLASILIVARMFEDGNNLYWEHKAASRDTALTLGGQLACKKIAFENKGYAVSYIICISSGVSVLILGVLLFFQTVLPR